MNNSKILIAFILLAVMQSCTKEDSAGEVIEDHFTYSKKINITEDSIRTGNGDWTMVIIPSVWWHINYFKINPCQFKSFDATLVRIENTG